MKDKKGIAITNAFQTFLDESGRKPNKIWVEKGSELYNRSMKSWLQDNDIEINSTQNEGKFVIAERFITTLKNKIYKYMTSVSRNVYIDKLDNIVNKYNNAFYSTIKMKPVGVKCSTYISNQLLKKLDFDKLENIPNNLSSLKSKIDKLYIDKLETTPVDLGKSSDEVKNNAFKRTEDG